MNQMKHISHIIFDGGLNFNFYTFEKNKKTVDIQCSMCYSIQVVVEKEKTI